MTMKRSRNRRWRKTTRRSKMGRKGGSIASSMFRGTRTAMDNEKLQINILGNKSQWSPFFPFSLPGDTGQAPGTCSQSLYTAPLMLDI